MSDLIEQCDLWGIGSGGYDTYRIPAIVATASGAILAFCEGRRNSRSDTGDIDLLMRRSRDGGVTWTESRIIWDDGPNTCGNPCPVVDQETSTVWLLLTHNLGHDHERQIIDQVSEGTRTVWVVSSGDEGETWTAPTEITADTKRENWTWYATGPGNGIQTRDGRLVIPCDHIEAATNRYYSHIIYSDDHGGTWRLGGSSPSDQVNECAVVALKDGTLLLNMRNYDRTCRTRQIASSRDGGLTWENQRFDDALIEPICQASMVTASESGNTVLFSNPASQDARANLTVRYSPDGGKTWPQACTLHEGPAAYSSLAVLPDGSVLCLYERGNDGPYERVTLARFPLEVLHHQAG